jgi:hypothetical protein
VITATIEPRGTSGLDPKAAARRPLRGFRLGPTTEVELGSTRLIAGRFSSKNEFEHQRKEVSRFAQ